MKKLWWNEELDKAFDLYVNDQTLTHDQREQLFNDKLYPALKILAVSIVCNNNSTWHVQRQMQKDELVNQLIAFAHTKFGKYDATKGASISSFFKLIMFNECYLKWKQAKKYNERFMSDDNCPSGTPEQEILHASDVQSFIKWNAGQKNEYNPFNDKEFFILFIKKMKENDLNNELLKVRDKYYTAILSMLRKQVDPNELCRINFITQYKLNAPTLLKLIQHLKENIAPYYNFYYKYGYLPDLKELGLQVPVLDLGVVPRGKTKEERGLYERRWYLRNKLKKLASLKSYYQKHRERILLRNKIRHAEMKNNYDYKTKKKEYDQNYYYNNQQKLLKQAQTKRNLKKSGLL